MSLHVCDGFRCCVSPPPAVLCQTQYSMSLHVAMGSDVVLVLLLLYCTVLLYMSEILTILTN